MNDEKAKINAGRSGYSGDVLYDNVFHSGISAADVCSVDCIGMKKPRKQPATHPWKCTPLPKRATDIERVEGERYMALQHYRNTLKKRI